MLTNPNTLGLFDENIAEITRMVRDAGGTLYYDGANLNAIMGHTRPGDMGFDIVHVNLHKSFSQPHGGGGPGAGPIAVSDRIEPYLPVPRLVRAEGGDGAAPRFDLDHERPKSIGRLRGFAGNFGVFVRSYAYIRSLGGDGLTEASETAVLNANYLLARLREGRAGRYLPVAFDRPCMHEFVLSGAPAKRELGVKTLDVAKRLLDFGFHPPTIYFPLLVDEALMFEPTETETREGLDALADAIEEILAEAERDPEIARNAPYTTPVRRLDEATASRRPGGPPAALVADAGSASGSSCSSSSTGANRSPCSSTRSSTAAASKRTRLGIAVARRAPRPPPSRSGVETRRPLPRPQRVDGDGRLGAVVLAPVDEHLALAKLLAIWRETTSSGSARSSAWATAWANGFVRS